MIGIELYEVSVNIRRTFVGFTRLQSNLKSKLIEDQTYIDS